MLKKKAKPPVRKSLRQKLKQAGIGIFASGVIGFSAGAAAGHEGAYALTEKPAVKREAASSQAKISPQKSGKLSKSGMPKKAAPNPAGTVFSEGSRGISVLYKKGMVCVSPEFIKAELNQHGSPATPYAKDFFELGKKYGIRPEVALAFFKMESTFGTHGIAVHNKSIGNIRYTTPQKNSPVKYTNAGGFRCYASWKDGIEDFYRLLSSKTYARGGLTTIEDIIPRYAPASENNVARYQETVIDYMGRAHFMSTPKAWLREKNKNN